MKKKMVALFVAALVSVSGATACGAVQDEVQQQAEDEVNQQKTNVEQRIVSKRRPRPWRRQRQPQGPGG